MRLEGKVAIITGAARGQGAAEAELFAGEGASVVFGDILEEEGRATEARIAEAGGTATFVRLDVTSEADWEAAVGTAVERYGRVDILVNNAGLLTMSSTDDVTKSEWDRVMDVNMWGIVLGTKAVVAEMRKVGGGSIVNISSISGMTGQSGNHMGYNASKGAVRIVTKSAAVQYAQDGIRVNSVHPGVMPPMRSSSAARNPEAPSPLMDHVPMGRRGETGEVGNAVLFLASDEASYITGAELVVDGGLTAT